MIGGGDASVTGWALELDLGGFGDEQGAVKRFDPGPAEQQGGDEGSLPAVSDAHAQAGGGVHGPWRDPHDPRTHVPDLKF